MFTLPDSEKKKLTEMIAVAQAALGASGREFYQQNFDIRHIVELLRAPSGGLAVPEK